MIGAQSMVAGYLLRRRLELWEQRRIIRKEHARRKMSKTVTKIPLQRRVLGVNCRFSQMMSVGSDAC